MILIFYSAPFDKRIDKTYEIISERARLAGFDIYRVDQNSLAGKSIIENIHIKIRESKIVIADITGNNPNVLNEVGLAQSLGKPLILISKERPEEAPFNIRGYHIQRYSLDLITEFKNFLDKALIEANSPNELLRSMLIPGSLGVPTRDMKFIIAASPLSYRRAMGRSGGYNKLRNTASDYVGIKGIFQAFGLLYGMDALPEIIDPEDFDDIVIHEEMNLYCIASPKANRWTGILVNEFNARWVPQIEFKADPASSDLRNVKVSLYKDNVILQPSGYDTNSKGDRYNVDYGLIIRGPNPFHENNMMSLIAGRSSLGTESASIAFTDPRIIKTINEQLSGLKVNIEDHKQPFWVLVEMKRNLLDEREEGNRNTLAVCEVAKFKKRN